jgi:light-regulated signal transduction histidine kinase (bacteriophytochrome)
MSPSGAIASELATEKKPKSPRMAAMAPIAKLIAGPGSRGAGRGASEEPSRAVARVIADLAVANRRLAATNPALEGFADSPSHDLRTPLRAIDDILAFSRVGRLDMTHGPVDMAALAGSALAGELAPAAVGRRLAIEIGELPDVHGDAALLRHVWINLLDNAIKFTAPKPDACIGIGARAGPGETVYFVRDTGVGFDMKYACRLFGVFQRLHGADFPGTGTGLAIVKRIVTRHGGRVWGEGTIGEGATFSFALPATGART